MKYSKLVMLGLIGTLTFGAVGCTNKTAYRTGGRRIAQSTTQRPRNMYTDMNLENYRTHFGPMYESNMAGFRGYEPITVEQPTANYPGNEKYVADLKKDYEESKKKVDELRTSLKKVDTKDPKVKEMNDRLIAESERISKELDTRIKRLNEIPSDLMTRPEIEFKRGISESFNVNETAKSDFTKFVNDTKEFFGIRTR